MDDRSIRPQKFLVFSTRWACKSVGVQESLCAQWRCICLLSSWAEMGDQILRTPLGSASKPFAALAELAILLKSQHGSIWSGLSRCWCCGRAEPWSVDANEQHYCSET
jgi:hypothetical protein